jgi:hypothetical protein
MSQLCTRCGQQTDLMGGHLSEAECARARRARSLAAVQAASAIPLAAQLAEARRELALRKAVYPKLMRADHLGAGIAAQRIALQEAIIATLVALVALERGQGELCKPPALSLPSPRGSGDPTGGPDRGEG